MGCTVACAPLAVPATWPIVSRWCITRFSLCLSVDCESHLTGLAFSSPARMRQEGGGGAQQDASAAFSFLRSERREIEKERGREYKGNENAICVRPFLFLPDMHFNCPPTLRGGHLRPDLLFPDISFCSVKLLNVVS